MLVASDQLSAHDAVISDRVVFSTDGLEAFVNRGGASAAPSRPEEQARINDPATFRCPR